MGIVEQFLDNNFISNCEVNLFDGLEEDLVKEIISQLPLSRQSTFENCGSVGDVINVASSIEVTGERIMIKRVVQSVIASHQIYWNPQIEYFTLGQV